MNIRARCFCLAVAAVSLKILNRDFFCVRVSIGLFEQKFGSLSLGRPNSYFTVKPQRRCDFSHNLAVAAVALRIFFMIFLIFDHHLMLIFVFVDVLFD